MDDDDARELRDTTIRHDGRIAGLEKAMAEQKPMLEAIRDTLSTLSSYNIQVVSGMKKTLYGNGSPGLVTDMTEMKATVENMLKIIAERKEMHDKEIGRVHSVLCWGGIALFGILVSMIGWLIPTLVRYLMGVKL